MIEIATLLGALGQAKEALHTIEQALDLYKSSDWWNCTKFASEIKEPLWRALQAIASFGAWEDARQVVERDDLSEYFVYDRCKLLAAIAAGLAKAKAWPDGEALVRRLKHVCDVAPVVEAFVKAACQTGDGASCALVVRAAARRLQDISDEQERIRLSRDLAPSLARAGEWTIAMKNTYAHRFDWDLLRGHLAVMPQQERDKEQALSNVATVAVEQGDLERAFQVMTEIRTHEGRDNAYVQLAASFAAQGDLEHMQDMLRRITETSILVSALPKVWTVLARTGKRNEAITLFQEGCLVAARLHHGRSYLITLLEEAVDLFADANECAILSGILEASHRVDQFFSTKEQ
jgi:tetratricopeptide (TPR) repeat protein